MYCFGRQGIQLSLSGPNVFKSRSIDFTMNNNKLNMKSDSKKGQPQQKVLV